MRDKTNYISVQGRFPNCYLCNKYSSVLNCNAVCNGESAFEPLEYITTTNGTETITISATDPLFVPISDNQIEPFPEPDLSQTIDAKVAEFKVELAKLGEILLQEIQSLKQAIFEKWEEKE